MSVMKFGTDNIAHIAADIIVFIGNVIMSLMSC